MKKAVVSLALLFVVGFNPIKSAMAGEVSRAQFTSNIEQREPFDEIKILGNNINKIYFFSELHELQDQTVTHRWQFAGKVMAEVSFNVGGPRWRINSSKSLLPAWIGDWTVSVVDGNGNVISEHSFQYIETEQ